MWVWRRVLRISWTERKTNKWVRERIGVEEKDGIVEQMKRERWQNICIGNGDRKVQSWCQQKVKDWGKRREEEEEQPRWTTSGNGLEECQWLAIMHGNK